MSEDPIGFAAGDANVNRYVGNGPTNATDPNGLEETTPDPDGFEGNPTVEYQVPLRFWKFGFPAPQRRTQFWSPNGCLSIGSGLAQYIDPTISELSGSGIRRVNLDFMTTITYTPIDTSEDQPGFVLNKPGVNYKIAVVQQQVNSDGTIFTDYGRHTAELLTREKWIVYTNYHYWRYHRNKITPFHADIPSRNFSGRKLDSNGSQPAVHVRSGHLKDTIWPGDQRMGCKAHYIIGVFDAAQKQWIGFARVSYLTIKKPPAVINGVKGAPAVIWIYNPAQPKPPVPTTTPSFKLERTMPAPFREALDRLKKSNGGT